MRKLCAVPGCSSGGEAPGHKFPKSVERSELWARTIQNYSLLQISTLERQTYKVCYKHFPESAYMVGKCRRLFPTVIPSLNLPEAQEGGMEESPIPGSSQMGRIEFERREETEQGEVLDARSNVTHYEIKTEDITQGEMPQTRSDVVHFEILAEAGQAKQEEHHDGGILYTRRNAPEYSPDISSSPLGFCTMCTSNRDIERERNRTTRNSDLTPRGLRLFKEIKKIAKKQKYAEKQNKTLRQKLKLLKKVSRPQFLQRYTQLSESQKLLIDMQLRTSENAPQGRRYTIDEKIVSLTIYKQSPRTYKLLRQLCNMPSIATVKKILHNIKLRPGICDLMIKHLSEEAGKLPDKEKYCILMWDEMALQPHISFHQEENRIIGVEDWGTRRTSRFADHALVFMLRGLVSGWKIPISFSFCESQTNTPQLLSCIKNVIRNVAATGFKVVATVCDQGTSNVAAINCLVDDTRRQKWKQGEEHRTHTIELDGNKIIPFYDPPHLMKSIRNNLLNKDLERNVNNEKKDGNREFASWKMVELAYKIDTHSLASGPLMRKITDEHIIPHKIRKMKVKCATQVFSYTVATCLEILALGKSFPTSIGSMEIPTKEGKVTGEVLYFFNKLFDSVNGHLLKEDAPLRTVVTETSEHHRFWPTAVRELKNMRYVHQVTKKPLAGSGCLQRWIKTIENFQELWKDLQSNGFRLLKSRYVNQDPLENFFGSIRATGWRNTNPTCTGFSGAYKTLLINNLWSQQSHKANCENICSGKLLFTLKEYLNQDDVENIENDAEILEILNRTISSGTSGSYIHINRKCLINQILHKSIHKQCNNCITTCRNTSFPSVILRINKTLYKMIDGIYFKRNITDILRKVVVKKISFNFIECSFHHESLKEAIIDAAITAFLQNWCERVNRMLSGKDSRKTKSIVMQRAQQKYNLRLKRKLRP